jgi:hypothetical protein
MALLPVGYYSKILEGGMCSALNSEDQEARRSSKQAAGKLLRTTVLMAGLRRE